MGSGGLLKYSCFTNLNVLLLCQITITIGELDLVYCCLCFGVGTTEIDHI